VLFLRVWLLLSEALSAFVLDVPVGDLAATLLHGKLFVCGGRYGIFLHAVASATTVCQGVGKC
jgi:hypothetical protein